MTIRRILAGLALAAVLGGCGDGLDRADAPEVIGFGAPVAAAGDWRPLADDMRQVTGLKVRPFVGSNENALVEAMRFGQADVGWFTAAGALDAVERAQGEVFARTAPAAGDLAGEPLVWRKDMDPALKEKVRQFFLTYGQGTSRRAGDEREELDRLSLRGFLPADDAVLLPVREVAAERTLEAAHASGDPARIDEAEQTLQAIQRKRADLRAKAGQPVAAP